MKEFQKQQIKNQTGLDIDYLFGQLSVKTEDVIFIDDDNFVIPINPHVYDKEISMHTYALAGVDGYYSNLYRLPEPQYMVLIDGVLVSAGEAQDPNTWPARKIYILREFMGSKWQWYCCLA